MKFDKGVPYEVCLFFNNKSLSLSAAVMQTEDTGLLPENIETLVTGKQTYDIYP